MKFSSFRVAICALLLSPLYLITCPYWAVMSSLQDYPHSSGQWLRPSTGDLGQQSNPITPLNTPSSTPTTPTEMPTSPHPVATLTPAASLEELQESLKSLEDRQFERFIGFAEVMGVILGLVAILVTAVGLFTAYHIRGDEKRARDRIHQAQHDISRQAEAAIQEIEQARARVREVEALRKKYSESAQLFVNDVETTGGILNHLMDVLDMLVDNSILSEEDRQEAYQKIGLTRSRVEYAAHLINLQSIDKKRRRSALFYFDRHGSEEVLPYLRSVIEDPQEDPALKEIAKQAIKDIIERAGAVESGKEKES